MNLYATLISALSFAVGFNRRIAGLIYYQLPDDPPPPELPPPPEKLLPPELQDRPELPDPPELVVENAKPPMEAFPVVRKSFSAFLYQLVCFKRSFVAGKPIR